MDLVERLLLCDAWEGIGGELACWLMDDALKILAIRVPDGLASFWPFARSIRSSTETNGHRLRIIPFKLVQGCRVEEY